MTTAAWIGAGTAAIGAVITTVAALEARRQRRRERTGRRAVGRVVDIVIKKSVGKGPSSLHYFPVFEFVTEAGRSLRRQSSTGSDPPAHTIGDEVDIWYNPDDPEQCDIRGEIRALSVAFALVGLLFFAAGIGVVLLARSE